METTPPDGVRPGDRPDPGAGAAGSPSAPRRGWQNTFAPNLIGLFLWVAFFDQIPPEALPFGGVLWPSLGAALGGLLAFLFLFHPPASWGQATGRPLDELTTCTFGVRGSRVVPGLVIALTQVVWMAVATLYGTALTLRGLVLLRLLDPRVLHAGSVGGRVVPGPLFLVTSLLWCAAAALLGRYLIRVIAALMNVYPAVPALILGVSTVLAFRGLRGFQPGETTAAGWAGGLVALTVTVQMVFGFFAQAGLASADWGAVTRDGRDVRVGGLVGVFFAPWVIATLAVLTAAGASARSTFRGPSGPPPFGPLSVTASLETLAGGRWAGVMLISIGLAAFAPACYAGFVLSQRLHDARPQVSRTAWTLLGVSAAWLLVAAGAVDRLFEVFSVAGALLAPAAGALAADRVRARGAWPGPRAGWNAPGLFAWTLGAAVGLAPTLARAAGFGTPAAFQPAAVFAFLAAFVGYLATAVVAGEAPPAPGDAG